MEFRPTPDQFAWTFGGVAPTAPDNPGHGAAALDGGRVLRTPAAHHRPALRGAGHDRGQPADRARSTWRAPSRATPSPSTSPTSGPRATGRRPPRSRSSARSPAPTARRSCRTRCPSAPGSTSSTGPRAPCATRPEGPQPRPADRPDAGHGRRGPGGPRGAHEPRAGHVRRQHGHPGDARGHHLLPGRQRAGRAVLRRRRALPAGRGRELRHGRRGRDGRHAGRRPGQGGAPAWPRLETRRRLRRGRLLPAAGGRVAGQPGRHDHLARRAVRPRPARRLPAAHPDQPLAAGQRRRRQLLGRHLLDKALLPAAQAYGGMHAHLALGRQKGLL